MFITGVGTAAPERRFAQAQCWIDVQGIPAFERLGTRARAIIRKVLTGPSGIQTRHLALETLRDAFDLNPDSLHRRFLTTAPRLATTAARNALREASVTVDEIDAIIISTCTGYLCPGLTSYVSEALGLRANVLPLDLVGQGCAAAIPNLRTADALLTSGRSTRVLSICVEVCSAAFYLDDDPGVLISACLFGDGAGAAVLSNSPSNARPIEWVACHSILDPAHRDLLRFEQAQGMLRNILSPRVPALAAEYVERVLNEGLSDWKKERAEIAGWLIHPGGRDILKAISERLALPEGALRCSAEVLSEFGNVSSPSLFFVLQAALADSVKDGYWWMSSFGAGFTCHGALLKVGPPG